MAITNLNEYYSSIGQALPSVSARAPLFAQYGGTGSYSGTAEQNNFLLSHLTGSSSGVITPSSLTPVQPLQTVTPTPEDPEYYNGITSGALNSFDSINTNLNEAYKQNNQMLTSTSDIMGKLLGKSADVAAANESSGLNASIKQLGELNSQASMLRREASAIPLQVQQNAANTGATDSGVAPIQTAALRNNAIKALSIAQQADVATANYTAAKDKAEQMINLKYEPLEQQLSYLKDQLELNDKYIITPLERKRADALKIALDERARLLSDKKDTEKSIQEVLFKAAPNAPSSVLEKMRGAKTVEEAILLGAKYFNDPLEDSIKRLQIQKLQQELSTSDSETDNKLAALSLQYADQPTSLLANIFRTSGAKSTKELTDASAVIAAAEALADKNTDKKFKGLGGFLVRLSRSPEAISNKSDVEGINLKVQQWASGASLTAEQIKQVKKMTPKKGDSDRRVANKLNALTNYMMSDISGRLSTQGISFRPNTVDFWGNKKVVPVSGQIGTALGNGYKPKQIVDTLITSRPDLASKISTARAQGFSDEAIAQFLIENE